MSDDWRKMKIVAAAIMIGERVWSLPPPARHYDVIRLMHEEGVERPDRGEQGFLTDTNNFVRRKPALMIAENAGQLKRKQGQGTYQGPELFSEDLW